MKIVIIKIFLIFIFFNPIFAQEIKLGMSADFSASISYLGNNMKDGIETYLKKINTSSLNSYKLISYDDRYNPLLASKNVRKLILEDNILALIGNLGTPTANVVMPILDEKKIVLFGAYSGGILLREKLYNKYVFNYRASYKQEAFYMVNNLFKQGIKPEEIAVFSQNDTYGDSGYLGVLEAYRKNNFDVKKIIHVRYTRNTLNIEAALSKLLDYDNNFKAIVMVSVEKPSLKFIKYAKEDFPLLKFFLLSPVEIDEIIKKLPIYKNDIFASQVVPLLSSKLPIVLEYKRSLKKYSPNKKENLISLEGYIVAKLLVSSIERTKSGEITKSSIYKDLMALDKIDIGLGFLSNFKNKAHQYSNNIWLTNYKKNKLVKQEWENIFKKD